VNSRDHAHSLLRKREEEQRSKDTLVSTYFLMHKCRVGSDNNKMLICFKDIYVNRLPVTIAKKVADRARKLENLSGQNSTKKFGATYY
jgi:hypothetical protein